MKADTNIMDKILAVYEAGRKVNMKQIMKHELIPVSVSISLHGTSSIIINGQALVVAFQKPQECHTFEDLADVSTQYITKGNILKDKILPFTDTRNCQLKV